MLVELTFFSYIIDRIFGEFSFIRHPVVMMGDYIAWFEKKFYQDSILRGMFLSLSLIVMVVLICLVLEYMLPWYIQVLIASMGIASKMLYDSVKDIMHNPKNIQYLVSRDTKELSQSDVNKAAIETYAENLSDGVVAPLVYLLFFGLTGLFVYKAINTLDSMVGYRNARFEKYGKFSAKLDDVVNFIPARITAFLIALLFFSNRAAQNISKYGHKHESPNAGYPISAMAGVLNISLGGPTSYFGTIKNKPYFGDGTKNITIKHIAHALEFQKRIDGFIILGLGGLYVVYGLV
ncbi:MAG: adenosylcobinamide-phosphate synthase CbiB [Campylobacterota bacterium]|nr:adenosylcobinamide-phosphate synthase CbiB [Campylobacterota bacterium]